MPRLMPGSEHDEPVTITVYRDGPLIVRGDVRLTDPDGNELDPGRRTVALCRCGRSASKPFCDGSHSAVGFRAAAGDERRGGLRPDRCAGVLDDASA